MNRVGWIFTILALSTAAIFLTDFDIGALDAEKKITPDVAEKSPFLASYEGDTRKNNDAEDSDAVFQSDVQLNTSAPIARADSKTADAVLKWVRVANSEDQKARDAAIDALATAPKAQALPLLQKLIGAGTAADRESALKALRALARSQGDQDNEIQNILRLTVYDGDESIAASAQSALDDVESDGGRPALAVP